MCDLDWHDEPPDKQGWYWRREKYRGQWVQPGIVYVAQIDGDLKTRSLEGAPTVEEMCAQWAGPIPKPSD